MHGEAREECLLFVEADPYLRRVVAESLERFGWRVDPAEGPDEAIRILENQPEPDILILDLDTTQENSEAVFDRFRKLTSAGGGILVTTDDRPTDEQRRTIQPDAIIYKPYDVRHLIKSIENLIANKHSSVPQT